MVTTSYIREWILVPEKTRAIRDAISAGTSQYGMQTFDQSLWDLFQAGLVNYETPLEGASNADECKLRMQGLSSTAAISRASMQTTVFGPCRFRLDCGCPAKRRCFLTLLLLYRR